MARTAINYRAEAQRIARANGIPPALFDRLISQESRWDPEARSPVGAIGLGQLMPGTAAGLGVDPHDPIQNLHGAAKYLAGQFKRFGSWPLALAAYNAGPAAVAHYGGVPPYKETQNYVKSIMGGAKGITNIVSQFPAVARAQTSGGIADIGGRLQEALQFAAPTVATQSILQRLGGTAGHTAQSGMTPIPLPPPPPQKTQEAFQQMGGQDNTPQVAPGGAPPVGGLNATFAKRFGELQAAVRQAGGDITIFSGARTPETQAGLYQQALRKYGSESEARKHVAPPGKSNHDIHAGLKHGMGDGALAGDLRGDLALAHRLAPHFGLTFPMSYEPWHIEPAGIR